MDKASTTTQQQEIKTIKLNAALTKPAYGGSDGGDAADGLDAFLSGGGKARTSKAPPELTVTKLDAAPKSKTSPPQPDEESDDDTLSTKSSNSAPASVKSGNAPSGAPSGAPSASDSDDNSDNEDAASVVSSAMSSASSSSVDTTQLLSNDPLFLVLGQFFDHDGKKIATILEEINASLKTIATAQAAKT